MSGRRTKFSFHESARRISGEDDIGAPQVAFEEHAFECGAAVDHLCAQNSRKHAALERRSVQPAVKPDEKICARAFSQFVALVEEKRIEAAGFDRFLSGSLVR